MENDISTIWVRIGRKGRKELHVGGAYREHKLHDQGDLSSEELLRTQRERSDRLVANWVRASNGARCVLIGDLNLDYKNWNNPVSRHISMVQKVKDQIESIGFGQIITEETRFWVNQADSLIDHIWVNCADRILNHWNMSRAASDHNVILCNLSLENVRENGHNTFKRQWKKFNLEDYRKQTEVHRLVSVV